MGATRKTVEPVALSVAARIDAERNARGWTQDKLAAESGVSSQTIWRIENGKVPDADQIAKICKAFGISPSQLWADAERGLLTVEGEALPDTPAS